MYVRIYIYAIYYMHNLKYIHTMQICVEYGAQQAPDVSDPSAQEGSTPTHCHCHLRTNPTGMPIRKCCASGLL